MESMTPEEEAAKWERLHRAAGEANAELRALAPSRIYRLSALLSADYERTGCWLDREAAKHCEKVADEATGSD
jgi:hypothetical protein